MSTIIVGGAGFIGSNIVTHLSTIFPRQQFVVLDNLSNTAPERVDELAARQNVVVIEGDMVDQETVKETFEQYPPTTIINATHAHSDSKAAQELVFGAYNLLSAASELEEKPLFIDISSITVYGEHIKEGYTTPGLESDQLQPQSMIAAIEAGVDLLTNSYFYSHGLPTITLRTTTVFGPQQNENELLPQLIQKALNNRDIQIDSSQQVHQNWLYIQDLMELLEIIIQTKPDEIAGSVFNIGGSTEYTVLEVSQLLLTILNRPSELISLKDSNQVPPLSKRIDCEKAQQFFNWTPKTDFKKALHETIQWYQLNTSP